MIEVGEMIAIELVEELQSQFQMRWWYYPIGVLGDIFAVRSEAEKPNIRIAIFNSECVVYTPGSNTTLRYEDPNFIDEIVEIIRGQND